MLLCVEIHTPICMDGENVKPGLCFKIVQKTSWGGGTVNETIFAKMLFLNLRVGYLGADYPILPLFVQI